MMGFIFVTLFVASSAFCVFDDLQAPPRPDISPWFSIVFPHNHTDRKPYPLQKPDQWTNVTFGLPADTIAVQFTANNKTNGTETIVWYSYDRTEETFPSFTISVVWWGLPWELNIGYK